MNTATNLLGWWPIVSASLFGAVAAIIAIRYKIPDILKRIALIDERMSSKKDMLNCAASKTDRCNYQQSECQKKNMQMVEFARKEVSLEVATLNAVVNSLSNTLVRIDERVSMLLNEKTDRDLILNHRIRSGVDYMVNMMDKKEIKSDKLN